VEESGRLQREGRIVQIQAELHGRGHREDHLLLVRRRVEHVLDKEPEDRANDLSWFALFEGFGDGLKRLRLSGEPRRFLRPDDGLHFVRRLRDG